MEVYMIQKPNYFGNTAYFILWAVVAISFMAANRVTITRYSPYQMLVWEIKANEGYRPWWYPDGYHYVDGHRKRSYSIGFGWNDIGGTRRNQIKRYTADGTVTYSEAMQITLFEINKWGRLHSDAYRNLALQLYSYNCGKITSGSRLGRCHNGAKIRGKRCGHPNYDVRKQHNRRREYELALWNHDWISIQKYTEYNKAHQTRYNVKLKNRGQYQ